jgi:hypothetical protein
MRPWAFVTLIGMLMVTAACRQDDQIQTYRVSKDTGPSMPMGEMPMMASAAPASGHRPITWKVPAGWTEQAPSAMRVGSFLIQGRDGKTAEVSIIPLSGQAGGDLANINRWRGQIQLDPISETDLMRQSQTINPGGRSMRLVDFANQGKRVVAAIFNRDGTTWFFKMMGDDATVSAAKPAFLQFLNDLHFHGQS